MNRNKLLALFVSNLANAIVHQILEKAIDKPEIAQGYNKEVLNSWNIAKRYREKILPIDRGLSFHDMEEVRAKIISKVRAELKLRITKGYANIDLSLLEPLTDKSLKDLGVA